jgi:hypothetical protein
LHIRLRQRLDSLSQDLLCDQKEKDLHEALASGRGQRRTGAKNGMLLALAQFFLAHFDLRAQLAHVTASAARRQGKPNT